MIAFVPARSGSKRIRDKNLLVIDGVSLIRRTLLLLKDIGFSDIVLSTDCYQYYNEAKDLNVNLDLRNVTYSTDFTSTSEVLVDWIERRVISEEALIFLWQVTSPFRTRKLVREFIYRAQSLQFGEMLMCVSEISKISSINENNSIYPIDYSFGSRSQDVKTTLVKENGLGYALMAKTLYAERSLFPDRVIPFITNSFCLDLDIDEERDYIISKTLIENGI